MIGDPLSPAQMVKVVQNLSKLDHPWNCPHGRPTMRHLYQIEPGQAVLPPLSKKRPLTVSHNSFSHLPW